MPAITVSEKLAANAYLAGPVPGIDEGSVLPDSYGYQRGESRSALVKRMQDAMQKTLAGLWPKRSPDCPVAMPQQALILAAVGAGAMEHVAAQAAGINPRTYRELRQRAEGRHPTRSPLPGLAPFFEEVDEARAQARLKREIVVADSDPRHWLRYLGRSQPGLGLWLRLGRR